MTHETSFEKDFESYEETTLIFKMVGSNSFTSCARIQTFSGLVQKFTSKDSERVNPPFTKKGIKPKINLKKDSSIPDLVVIAQGNF